MRALLILFYVVRVFSEEDKPTVIIIGAGAAGVAAAARLLDNGITDLTILEAESIIGGRVKSLPLGDNWVNIGAHWVHGQKNNIVFELASPLGLLSEAPGPGEPDQKHMSHEFYKSTGERVLLENPDEFFEYINKWRFRRLESENFMTVGENMLTRLKEYFDNHTEIPREMQEPLIHSTNLITMGWFGVDWSLVSLKEATSSGFSDEFQYINWKNETYAIILDILMKKYPNPEEELPIVNKTLLNKKIVKIKYDDEPVRVTTADGDEYLADHVISTLPLGVMKAEHKRIFDPELPEHYVNAIENIGNGMRAPILLYYDEPWWDFMNYSMKCLVWTDNDRKKIENDPQKSWLLGVSHYQTLEYRPKVFILWTIGNYCKQMEGIPDDVVKEEILELIDKFFGPSYNITQPRDIVRSLWNTNDNFRGSYSYPALAADRAGVTFGDLAVPVERNGKPVLQFAGEATDPIAWSTVHGAINSGRREADRIIDLYSS